MPLSEILYFRLVGRAELKLCTNLELSSFTGFGYIVEGMPKILGDAKISRGYVTQVLPPFTNIILHFCGRSQDEAGYQI